MPYRLAHTDSSPGIADNGNWERRHLPDEVGRCFTDRLQLDSGIALAYSSYTPACDLIEESVSDLNLPVMILTLTLEGRSIYRGGEGRAFEFSAGHTTATVFSTCRGERRFRANDRVRQLRLIVAAPVLQKYALGGLLADDDGASSARQLYFGETSMAAGNLGRVIARLYSSSRPCLLELEIATLSLLSEHVKPLLPEPPVRQWRSADEAKILLAREILLEQFSKPLTIAYLCARVGVNECKLKQGFRELFETSPHRMLTEIRMRRAWELLEAGERVSSVGYSVGYSHPANFSAAFSRFYGRSPRTVFAATT